MKIETCIQNVIINMKKKYYKKYCYLGNQNYVEYNLHNSDDATFNLKWRPIAYFLYKCMA